MAKIPAGKLRRYRRRPRHTGVLLDMHNDQITFDLYVVMAPQVNVMDVSRAVQTAIVEAIDRMIGMPVATVNIHIEDVTNQFPERA